MSNGSEELAHLAHLLRVGARAARQIASVRPADEEQIDELAARIDLIAQEFDTITASRTSERLSQQMVQGPPTDARN